MPTYTTDFDTEQERVGYLCSSVLLNLESSSRNGKIEVVSVSRDSSIRNQHKVKHLR